MSIVGGMGSAEEKGCHALNRTSEPAPEIVLVLVLVLELVPGMAMMPGLEDSSSWARRRSVVFISGEMDDASK
jgi:hypothetical protein